MGELLAKLQYQADVAGLLKSKEMDELLATRDVKALGTKPQKAKQVVIAFPDPAEVHAFRAEQTAEVQAARRAAKRDKGQLTIQDAVKRARGE